MHFNSNLAAGAIACFIHRVNGNNAGYGVGSAHLAGIAMLLAACKGIGEIDRPGAVTAMLGGAGKIDLHAIDQGEAGWFKGDRAIGIVDEIENACLRALGCQEGQGNLAAFAMQINYKAATAAGAVGCVAAAMADGALVHNHPAAAAVRQDGIKAGGAIGIVRIAWIVGIIRIAGIIGVIGIAWHIRIVRI